MTATDAERAAELADVLSNHSQLVADGTPLHDSLAQLVRGACKLTDTPETMGGFRVVNPDTLARRQDVPLEGWVFDVAATELDRMLVRAADERLPVIVDNVDDDSPLREHDVRSELFVPLLVEYRCWGVLYLQSPELGHFTTGSLHFVEAIARQAALTIHYDDLQAYAEPEWDIRPRLHPGPALSVTPRYSQLQENLRGVAAEILRDLDRFHASVEVLLMNQERDALATLALVSEPAGISLPGYMDEGANTVAWAAVSAREPIKLRDLQAGDPSTSIPGSISALAIPLRDSWGQIIGVLSVESPTNMPVENLEGRLRPHCEHIEDILRATDSATRAFATSRKSVMNSIALQARQLVDPDNLEGLYTLVLRRASQLIGLPDLQLAIAFTDLIDDQYLTITPDRTYNYPLKLIKTWSWKITKGITGRAVRTREPQLATDARADPEYLEQDESVRSELAVPILRERQSAFGVLDVSSPHPQSLRERHCQMVAAFAAAVSVALDRAERIQRISAMAHQRDIIRNTNAMINTMLSESSLRGLQDGRDKVLTTLVNEARQLTNAKFGTIIEAAEVPEGPNRAHWGTDTELVRILAVPRAATETRRHWHASKGVTGAAFRDKRHKAIEDVQAYIKSGGDYINLYGSDIRSELAVPILAGDRVLGVLNLESQESRMFSPAQVDGVQLLASQVANVLSAFNAQLALSKLRLLSDVLEAIMRDTLVSLDHPQEPISLNIQRAVLEAARQLTGHDNGYASLWLRGPDGLRLHHCLPDDTPVRDRGKAGLVALAQEWQQPMLALDVTDPVWSGTVQINWHEARSELAVPLLISERELSVTDPNRVVGVLNVESPLAAGFTLADIDILRILARATVAAMHNHEAYRKRGEMMSELIHATRKPSLTLSAAVEALGGKGVNPEKPGFRRRLYRRQVKRLKILTNLADRSLLWFYVLANHESGKQIATMRYVKLDALISGIVQDMRAYVRAMGDDQDIEMDVPRDVHVYCVRELIEAALFLLIENAFTHGPDHVQVAVTLVHLENGNARIAVSSTGGPIPVEERQSMWSRGIGLLHVQRIMDIHGGHAEYEERADRNVFLLEIPAGQPSGRRMRRR